MKPTDFAQRNGLLGGGPGATYGATEAVIDLPVHRGNGQITSCWKLTWRERFALLWRGRVWLIVLSARTHAPVCVQVESPLNPEAE